MWTRDILTAGDLASMLAAVFEFNQRGQVQGVQFFDVDGKPVQLGWAEVLTESPGLRIRAAPEMTPEQIVARVSQQPVDGDPRQVAPPMSFAELDALMKA